MADQMCLLDAHVVHHTDQIVGHLVDRVANFRARALAGTAMIVDDDLKFLRKGRDVRDLVARDTAKPGNQQHGNPPSMRFVIDFAVGDWGFGHGCSHSDLRQVAVCSQMPVPAALTNTVIEHAIPHHRCEHLALDFAGQEAAVAV